MGRSIHAWVLLAFVCLDLACGGGDGAVEGGPSREGEWRMLADMPHKRTENSVAAGRARGPNLDDFEIYDVTSDLIFCASI